MGCGEFLIGISLMIGLLSRVASIFGCALMLAMWLSGGYPGPHAALWMYWGASLNWSVFAICFALLAVGRPEEVASVRRIISAGRRSEATRSNLRFYTTLTQQPAWRSRAGYCMAAQSRIPMEIVADGPGVLTLLLVAAEWGFHFYLHDTI